MLEVLWLIPALPLAGFLVLLLFGRRLGEPLAGWWATVICFSSFLVTGGVFLDLLNNPSDQRSATDVLFTWMPSGGLTVDLGLLADPLSVVMALFVTGVGSLIHLYAIGYMHGDEKFSKFFLYLNLFVFSMLMLVLGSNLVVTFLGWEGVGVCSYFLISFWQTRESAAVAGKKAFVTNRIGDLGFMLAIFLAFQYVGSVDYAAVNHAAEGLARPTVTALALLLFLGATGKSAQIPLYLWLPDAMEGPTPVSALIHAATMVTAGVYLMTRVNPVLHAAPGAANTVAIIGAATALFAATCAVSQTDIKKVLAYSTISQLGFMFLAVGCGAYVAAVFHMVTHAFFKALLFLGSGSVIHGLHQEQDMRHMGALRKFLPVTWVTFMIGYLALAGVPPFAGFWSKDDVLLNAWDKNGLLWAVGIAAAILTAYYMTRQVILVWYGESRWDDAKDTHDATEGDQPRPHESPWLMLAPLCVLAVLSTIGGALNLPFGSWDFLTRWLEPVVEESERHLSSSTDDLRWVLAGVATAAAAAGIAVAWAAYSRRKIKVVEPALLAHAWYIDEGVAAFVGGPGRAVFQAVADGDHGLVDGAVNGMGAGVSRAGSGLRRFQTGLVRSYAVGIALGAVALIAWFVSRGLL